MSGKLAMVTVWLFAVMVTPMLTLSMYAQLVKAESRVIHVPMDYSTIQEAIEAANPGDTVFVSNGTYVESVEIRYCGMISLIGENKSNTIINASKIGMGIWLNSYRVNISGFTILTKESEWAYGYWGIYIKGDHNHIYDNIVQGICLDDANGTEILNNTISKGWDWSIYGEGSNSSIIRNNVLNASIGLLYCSNNTIDNNVLDGGHISLGPQADRNIVQKNSVTFSLHGVGGIDIGASCYNVVTENKVDNSPCGMQCHANSHDNQIFHNDFENNIQSVLSKDSTNIWDDGYPSGGNYWSDYTQRYPIAAEIDDSGIWNTQYIIDANNRDNYPLMSSQRHQHATRELPVPYENQGDERWCWAASIAMILNYYGKPVHVWDIGKIPGLMSLWLSAIASYINQEYPDELKTEIGSYSTISNQTRIDIEGNLSRGYPVLLNVETYGGRHNVVVTGYNSSGFFVNDPSGVLVERSPFPYIHAFLTWEELQPCIYKDVGKNDVFLVVKGTPKPISATLFVWDNWFNLRTTHDLDSKKGVFIDYGGWWSYLGLYWNTLGWHSPSWDSKDTLDYKFYIFNHKNQSASFDFHFQIIGVNGIAYYDNRILSICLPAFGGNDSASEKAIPLKNYLVKGQKYVVRAEIRYHGMQNVIDSVTLPPINFDVKSITFMTECPVKMLITDPEGFCVGFDPVLNQRVNNITDVSYFYGNSSEPEIVSIPNKKDGIYSVKVFGIEGGTYNLTCTIVDETGFLTTQSYLGIPIGIGESQTYIIPEFHLSMTMSIFIAATVVTVILYRRKHAK